jgi:hypothetical protein
LSAPLNCSPNPISFGSVMVSQASTIQVTCTANVAISNPSPTIASTLYQVGPAAFPASVASGGTFSFPVVSRSISSLRFFRRLNSSADTELDGCKSCHLRQLIVQSPGSWRCRRKYQSVRFSTFRVPSRYCDLGHWHGRRFSRIPGCQPDNGLIRRGVHWWWIAITIVRLGLTV